MERYCGLLQPAIRSRRFPYSSINRYVVDKARLQQIMLIYDCSEALSLRGPNLHGLYGGVSIPGCKLSLF